LRLSKSLRQVRGPGEDRPNCLEALSFRQRNACSNPHRDSAGVFVSKLTMVRPVLPIIGPFTCVRCGHLISRRSALVQRKEILKGRLPLCAACRARAFQGRTFRIDTPLKTTFLETSKTRGMTIPQAARASGIPVQTIYDWLQRKMGFLSPGMKQHLQRMANFLGITSEAAVHLQGGTKNRRPEKAIAWWNNPRNLSKKAEAQRKAHPKRRGPRHSYSQEMRQKVSQARAGKPRNFKPTRQYRVGLMLRALRRFHPEASDTELESMVVQRVVDRWALTNRGAAGLVASVMRKGEVPGRPRQVDFEEVHGRLLRGEKEPRIALHFGVSIYTIRNGYRRWLANGGHLRATGDSTPTNGLQPATI
jgi:transposase